MAVNNIISIITFFITAIVSILVLIENFKSRIHRIFVLLGLSVSLWIAANLFADLSTNTETALFFSKLAIVWAAFMPLFFNQLIYRLYFSDDLGFTKLYKKIFLLFISSTILILLLSPTSLNIESISLQPWGADFQPGILYYFLFLYLLVSFAFAFGCLYRVCKNFKDPQKSQARLILIGSIITLLLVILTNIITPILGDSFLSLFGPSTIIFFICFIAYAITRHHLFNIKIVATELVTSLLWIFLLFRTLLTENAKDMIIEGSLLIITIIVGVLLIRSVVKEVAQREKIELLATDLQKANDRLRELDKQKSEFVSFATHQLRAPLTAMKGYASLILEGDLGKLSREIKNAITRIYDSSNTLANIVDDYLNISRIELGSMKYSFENVDLKDLLDHVIGELRPNIEKSKLNFVLNLDRSRKYMVNVDKDKFKQIVANLVDNAIKYTPVGSVTVTLAKKMHGSDHKIIFSVKDNGIGIAPEVLPKLFAKFTRADNGTRQNIHGTGLGLYVAKEIVTAHKGRIWAESPGEGKGSVFFVELDEVI
jgi:signal transduction histidine kinase